MSLKERYDLYLQGEEADVDPIPFTDFCRWYCYMTGIEYHQLFEDETFKQFFQDVS